jgi:hypothetical protein
MKVKSPGKSESHFIVGRGKSIGLLQGSQALPVRPSDKINVTVETLEWLEAVA